MKALSIPFFLGALLAGCVGPADPASVAVIASLDSEGQRLERTIVNRSAEPILYQSSCGGELQRRDTRAWVDDGTLPYGYPIICTLILIGPRQIDPGESLTAEYTDLALWQPGEYRFRVLLLDEHGARLPESPASRTVS